VLHRQRTPRLALAAALLVSAVAARAQTRAQLERELEAIGVVERLGAQAPLDLPLVGEDGRRLTLRDLAAGPVLLSFNYTSCSKLCGLQLAGLARALRDVRWKGEGFRVLTVSIDPADTPARLRGYEETFVGQAGGGAGVAAGWRFAGGEPEDVEALADAVGFRYRFDPATGQFWHQATLVVLTADGRVSGYLHGVTYAADALRDALARAGAGRIATAEEQATIGGFLLSCIGFSPDDPLPLALKVMRAAGVGVGLFLVSFLGVQVARDLRRATPRKTP
jgi:protein SCO1/2